MSTTMLDQLPPEVFQYILNHLLILRYEKRSASGKSLTGFVHLHSWNEISNYHDILALAHTCKNLKLMVYPVIFKVWAHIDKKYGEFLDSKRNTTVKKKGVPFFYSHQESKAKKAFFFLPRMTPSDATRKGFFPEWLISLSNPPIKPQFYILGTDMVHDGLQYIQHLSVLFNNFTTIHSNWLPYYLPKMISLKHFTLNMDGPLEDTGDTSLNFVRDFELVIKLLKNHPNTLAVHMYLYLGFKKEEAFRKYLHNFQKSWSDWTNLVIETLFIEIRWFEYSIPEEFSKSLEHLSHLKSLSLRPSEILHMCESTIMEGDPITKTLAKLPQLEEFSVQLRCPKCRYHRDNEQGGVKVTRFFSKQ